VRTAAVTIATAVVVVVTLPGAVAHEHGSFPTLAEFSQVHMERAFPRGCSAENPGTVSYSLDAPARVRIRVVAAGTRELFLRHITDWEVRSEGSHTESWDCLDNSGHPIDKMKAVVRLIGEPMSTYEPGTMPLEELSAEETIHGHEGGHTHNKHHEWACHESRLRISKPTEDQTVSGRFTVRSSVEPDRRGYGDSYGYGVRYYLDFVLVNEEFYKPESGGEFAYDLDTTAFRDGEHVLHLGMCDHNDHATSASVRIVIDNSSLAARH